MITDLITYIISSCFDLLVEFVLVLIPEWGVAHQQDVQDHTYTRTQIHCVKPSTIKALMQARHNSDINTEHVPHAQMSTGLPYGSFLRTSGERYPGVPAKPAHRDQKLRETQTIVKQILHFIKLILITV